MSESRTSKSIKNAEINILFFLAQMFVNFWARKVFYDYLGSEILGLDTTATSLLQLLNIAESGFGAAVAFFLYKPFYENDRLTIRDIIFLQRWIYRKIAFVIILLALILMCFFPYIFRNISIPLWYAYATFGVLLFGNLLGYYVNYRESLLSADQKSYKVVTVTQFSSIFFRIILIFYLPHAAHPFYPYLGTTLLGYIVGSIWLNHVIHNEYPWLKNINKDGRELVRKYPDILVKTKQLFIHKVAGFVANYFSPLIMYSFSSLSIISYYGNYLAITEKAKGLFFQVFSSTGASVGNLIASNDKDKMFAVFWELFDSRLCLSTIVILTLYKIIDPFISVWLSPDFLLSKEIVILILINSWLFINRCTIDNFKDGFGLFQDVWAPIIESIINIVVSIICGIKFGINGVLLGGIVSTVLIIYGWKPYYLFSRGFNINSIKFFFIPFVLRCFLLILICLFLSFLFSKIQFEPHTFIEIFLYFMGIFAIVFFVLFSCFSLLSVGMKSFNKRIFKYFFHK